jgi:hypothetical protein
MLFILPTPFKATENTETTEKVTTPEDAAVYSVVSVSSVANGFDVYSL